MSARSPSGKQALSPYARLAAASGEAARAIARLRSLAGAGDIDGALREADRAWRRLPEDTAFIAPVYARLLAADGRDPLAALRLLQRAAQYGPDPRIAALTVDVLLQLGRVREAVDALGAALASYCVVPGEALARTASRALADPGAGIAGWVGLGPELEFVWQLGARADAMPGAAPGVRADERALPGLAPEIAQADGARFYRWRPPDALRAARFEFHLGGATLVGGARSLPPDFALDGRTSASGRVVHGWARMGWAPGRRPRVQVQDESGAVAWARVARAAHADASWPFELDLGAAGLRGARLRVSVELPGGGLAPLPDSPLLLAPALRLPASARLRARRWQADVPARARARAPHAPPVDVIVPVHGAREDALGCIGSVLATLEPDARLVVVDDASEDAQLSGALDALARAGRIELLRNRANLGFAASVNRALALHPAHDAVLLNSDALVFGDWLGRLRAAAYRFAQVGTVTPLTNSGTIAGYPFDGCALDAAQGAALHELAATVNCALSAPLPVGVGHCLYLRRACLAQTGGLDEAVFGRGYGEETDFCLRARARGWAHVLAADVFVLHAGARSFGALRLPLLERSARLVDLRHPGYDGLIRSFLAADPVAPLRRRLDEARLGKLEGGFVLFLTSGLTGGTDRVLRERGRSLREQGLIPLVMHPAQGWGPGGVQLWTDAAPVPSLRYAVPAELDGLRALLGGLRIERVEVQHFLRLDARAVELVLGLGRPYDAFLHDYAWICPRVTLIGAGGRYCGEPAVAKCEACVRKNGSLLEDPIGVGALRDRGARWLAGARSVTVPSQDALARYRGYFPGLSFRVQAHAPVAVDRPVPAPAPGAGTGRPKARQRARVGLIGALAAHKGYRVLLDCARDAARRRLPLEFVVIGHTEDDARLERTGRVFVTGRYGDEEASHLLLRERPQLIFMASVWPETWCYALDHALRTGLPVVAFDIGAIAQRLRATKRGSLLALDADARAINRELLRVASAQQTGAAFKHQGLV